MISPRYYTVLPALHATPASPCGSWEKVTNPTETTHLRLGPEPTWPKSTVFQLRSHSWFWDPMELRFLMSHCRKNSVRDKVIGKKLIYLE